MSASFANRIACNRSVFATLASVACSTISRAARVVLKRKYKSDATTLTVRVGCTVRGHNSGVSTAYRLKGSYDRT